MRTRITAALVLAALAAVSVAFPADAAVATASCPGCGGLPAWSYAVLAVVGVLLAIGILWLPQRLARDVRSARYGRLIVVAGWVILTIAFVLGVRALVLLLGGT